MGTGWHLDFSRTHFDSFSPPDFYTKVRSILFCIKLILCFFECSTWKLIHWCVPSQLKFLCWGLWQVYIVGVPADCGKQKTKIIEDEWIPVWDEEFTFPLTIPELAILRIEVREYDRSEKDDFGGQNCLPVSELKPGIRAVPLYDKKGEKFKSVKLLMRFQFV